nr:MAG TPA: Alginate and motility regulator [Caudoviricetes sp.]
MEKVCSNGCGRSNIYSLEVGEMAGNSEYRNKWISEKLDRVNLTMPKGQKETIKAHAGAQGESLNAFINRAITETMERDGAATED